MDTNPVEYWDAQARDYDTNIFSTIDEDFTKVITKTLDLYAAPTEEGPFGCCVDLGCGAGKYLPALASRFRRVVGYDLSPKLVSLAKKEAKSRGATNVEVRVRDLSQAWYRDMPLGRRGVPVDAADFGGPDEMGTYGFAVMANVLIAPVDEAERALMLRNALRSLCPGGRLLVIVPSWESALYVNMRCDDANYEGPADLIKRPSRAEGADLLHGVLRRSGVRTKHYLEPEFRLFASRVGFTVELCEKVLYTWRSELGLDSDFQVPAALRDPPLPWDWLFVLSKPEATPPPPPPRRPSPPQPAAAAAGGLLGDPELASSGEAAATAPPQARPRPPPPAPPF